MMAENKIVRFRSDTAKNTGLGDVMEIVKIRVGDYIKSDFFSPIQGRVISIGLAGQLLAYLIETPCGNKEVILQGQAILLWTKEEYERAITIGNMTEDRWGRHD